MARETIRILRCDAPSCGVEVKNPAAVSGWLSVQTVLTEAQAEVLAKGLPGASIFAGDYCSLRCLHQAVSVEQENRGENPSAPRPNTFTGAYL